MKKFILSSLIAFLGILACHGQGNNLIHGNSDDVTIAHLENANFSSEKNIARFLDQFDLDSSDFEGNKAVVFIWQPYEISSSFITKNDICDSIQSTDVCGKTTKRPFTKKAGSTITAEEYQSIMQDDKLNKKITIDQKKEATSSGEKMQLALLHKEDGEWSPYLSNTRKIKVVVLCPEKELPEAIRLTIENGKTRLESSFSDLLKLVEATAGGTMALADSEDRQNWYLHTAEVNPENFRAPSTLQFHTSDAEDAKPTEIKVHERGILEFRAGLAGAKLDFQNISLANDTLSISTDSAGRVNWKENLVVGIELHFPRDYDRLQPIWKSPENRFLERLGVMAGFKVSARPLDAFYLGGTLALTRDFALWAGVSLQQQPKEQETATSATDLPSALKTAENERTKPKFFLGISVSPSGMIKALKD